MTAIGIPKREFATRARVDRGTLDRALADDEKISPTTWGKIESTLAHLEEELGMANSGNLVTTTIKIGDAQITVKGAPDEVAATVRGILSDPA